MHASPLSSESRTQFLPPHAGPIGVETLDNSSLDEVKEFLSARPLHTAYLAGLVNDNGLVSEQNRGIFYSYRNCVGQLEGVALIGHAVLMEATTDFALQSFAETAKSCANAHLIMCEEERLEKFWNYYTTGGKEMRRACREILFELRWPVEVANQPCKLRLATADDLHLLIPVHAQMALEESGVDPREHDGEGFAKRYARRVEQGRTWLLTENDQLIFKADVVAATADCTYIEGVWVNPEARRQGYGRSCMSQLARMLLWQTKSLCLFVNDDNEEAQAFYRQAGYHVRTVYDTIFLQ